MTDPTRFAARPGEVRLAFDPADDARAAVTFIGRIRSPWQPDDCPRSIRSAREAGRGPARLEIDAPYRPGLAGLAPGDGLVLLYWMAQAPRDLIVQAPRHRVTPSGVFALRSPARPNPVAMSVVRCLAIDADAGIVTVDAIDAYDGTPLIDIKPWIDSIDLPPAAGAVTGT